MAYQCAPLKLTKWTVLLLVTVQLLGCGASCQGTATEIFACDLVDKTDSLIEQLEDAKGLTTTTWVILINGKQVESDQEIAKISLVAARALAITDHISQVPPSLIEELGKVDTDSWGSDMRALFQQQRERILPVVAQFEKQVRESPEAFSRQSDFYAAATDPFIVGEYFGWSSEDELYVRMPLTGDPVFIGRTLSVDIDDWLTSILSNVEQ